MSILVEKNSTLVDDGVPEHTTPPKTPDKKVKSPLGRALLHSFDQAFKSGQVPMQAAKAKIPNLEDIKDLENQIQRISLEKGWDLNA